MSFKIFLIYHSHIDIGYTERQEKIAVYQADFIKQAVENVLSHKQNTRDFNTKFKFTAEGFWAVEQYLKKYGEVGKERLLKAINTGYFELTGCYLHLAELLNYDNLSRSLDYAKDFAAGNELKEIDVAMASDINGFSWGFADAMYDHNIRYLSTNINTHHGGAPFGKPLVPFYWETKKGRRILVWNGLTYHKANLMGLIPGLAPSDDPGVPGMIVEKTGFANIQSTTDVAEKHIFEMINALKDQNYEYDFLPIMGSGLYTDNSPVGDEHCKLIEYWNGKHADEVEIVTATLKEFFKYLEENAKDIPVYSGDWNDWWTDGALSTSNELKLFRNAQRLQSIINKTDPEKNIISEEEHERITNKLILFAEHTWGHSSSHGDPCKLLVQQLDFRKAKHAIDADVLASEAFDKLLRGIGEGEFTHKRPFTYNIFNPHDFDVKSVIYMPTDFWEEGHISGGEYNVYDQDGNKLLCQRTFTLRGSFITAAVDIKGKERKRLRLVFEKTLEDKNSVRKDIKECLNREKMQFENEYYIFSIDNEGKVSVLNKKTGNELINKDDYNLGQPVYQVFPGANRSDAAGFGYSARTKPKDRMYFGKINNVGIIESGAVFTKIKAVYDVEGAKRYCVYYTLYNDLAKIDVSAEMVKDLVLDPEGMYISFPFSINNAKWHIDKPGAFINPGDQLPETCCDYYPVDRGIVLKNDDTSAPESVVINTFDSPLFMFGGLNLWDFNTQIDPSKGSAYSWLLNNKWETNFRAQCAGFYENRYVIEITDKNDEGEILEKNNIDILCMRN